MEFVQDDIHATNIFFEEYGGIMRYIANKLDPQGNVIDKDDLFYEIVRYILENKMDIILKFKQKCKFSTYLYSICKRYGYKKLRQENRMPGADGGSPPVENLPAMLFDEIEVWDDEMKSALSLAIKQLDQNSRVFIRMHFYDNKTVEDLMHMFGWKSNNCVYSKKNRIINKLRMNMRKVLKKRRLTSCVTA